MSDEPEESHKLLDIELFTPFESGQLASENGEKASLNQLLKMDRKVLKSLVFLHEAETGPVYLQIKKSFIENGLVLQI